MKRISKITGILLLGGFVGTLSVLSVNDATAQRRSRRAAPARTRIVKVLPQGFETLEVDEMELFHFNGVFYRKSRDNFTVIHAPRGAVVDELPDGYETIPVTEGAYFRFKNTFFTEESGGYAVTTPPFGKSVPELPAGYETLATRGDADIYFHNGFIYKADPESDTYKIVKPRRRARTGRGSARFSNQDRRGGSRFGHVLDRRREFDSGRRRNFTPERMRQRRRS